MALGNVWIIGADGSLGRVLSANLVARGVSLTATTRRVDCLDDRRRYLDLGDPACWPAFGEIDTAFICAGATSLTACRYQPHQTRSLNVTATAELARRLNDSGAFIVYPSTNQVFDGLTPMANATTTPRPQTEYGRQKADAERHVLALGEQAAVVRLTKVLAAGNALLEEWREALRSGHPIQPFSDLRASTIPMSLVVNVLVRVAESRLSGITQISADRDVTYAEVAQHLTRKMAAPEALLTPISSTDAGVLLDALPKHTTLDTSRLTEVFGIKAPDPLHAVDEAIA